MSPKKIIAEFIPGLHLLMHYDRSWFRSDLFAGLSVAAIQIPTAIAYAQLAGFPLEMGLYACILPMLIYSLIGSSRQLMIGPDAATCTMVGAVLLPLAAGDANQLMGLSVILTFMVGVFSILGGIARLGFVANFLSRPILIGFLNGIGLSILFGQLGKILGFSAQPGFKGLYGMFGGLGQTHIPTLLVGLLVLGITVLVKKWKPRWPAPLLAIAGGTIVAVLFQLQKQGVAITGPIPGGLPRLHIPSFEFDTVRSLLQGAVGITIVSFCSGVLTASSFASRNGYALNPNREFISFGIANLGSAISQGFVISGADSRTAINDLAGGKSQMVGIVASMTILLVLLFFTAPLSWIPQAALGAVLMVAAYGLLDFRSLRAILRADKFEFWLSIITTVGVLAIGVLPGIILAINLTLLRVLQLSYRPADAVLGWVRGIDGQVNIKNYPNARTLKGLIVYRFGASLLFFNAEYFKSRILSLVSKEEQPVAVLFVAETVAQIDVSGVEVLRSLKKDLEKQGVRLAIARPQEQLMQMLVQTGVVDEIGRDYIFSSVRSGIQHYRHMFREKLREAEGEGNPLQSGGKGDKDVDGVLF